MDSDRKPAIAITISAHGADARGRPFFRAMDMARPRADQVVAPTRAELAGWAAWAAGSLFLARSEGTQNDGYWPAGLTTLPHSRRFGGTITKTPAEVQGEPTPDPFVDVCRVEFFDDPTSGGVVAYAQGIADDWRGTPCCTVADSVCLLALWTRPDSITGPDERPAVGASAPRSSKWPACRAAYLKDHPRCAACFGKDYLEVHHVKPFHLHPELELEPANLITLCENPTHNCHFIFGHVLDWRLANPFVRDDAGLFHTRCQMARIPTDAA